ncbi:MAG: LysM peptidoglycan-binding domain-containing protein [Elusimicrobiota bacterium]
MIYKKFLLFTFYFLLFTSIFAQQKERTYRVWIWQENGDCLWNIAKRFYGDGRKWKIIYEANKNEIKDPRKIYPKQKLIIPEKTRNMHGTKHKTNTE